ncbi:hypothetical protein N9Z54_07965 [Planctomycetota bacterium]|jgi:hypothetical protein|nr:hypothetical protein [Planctomycetota bacterium]
MTRPNALASANNLRRAGLAFAAGLLATSCASNTGDLINDHWRIASIEPRVVRAATGYDPSQVETYGEYRSSQWSAFGLTFQRHIMGFNPTNPFQAGPTQPEEHEWTVPANPYADGTNGAQGEDKAMTDVEKAALSSLGYSK